MRNRFERGRLARGDRRSLGAEGEERAAAHLAQRGYRIVGRNVRMDGVEIDLIAARGPLLVFVEVKTRRSERFGPPEAAVHPVQQARLARGAGAWLRAYGGRVRRVRFDVIALRVGADEQWQLDHLEGAFDAGP